MIRWKQVTSVHPSCVDSLPQVSHGPISLHSCYYFSCSALSADTMSGRCSKPVVPTDGMSLPIRVSLISMGAQADHTATIRNCIRTKGLRWKVKNVQKVSHQENGRYQTTMAMVMRQEKYAVVCCQMFEVVIAESKHLFTMKATESGVGLIVECKSGTHRANTICHTLEQGLNDVRIGDQRIFLCCHFAASEFYGRHGSEQLVRNAVEWRCRGWPCEIESIPHRARRDRYGHEVTRRDGDAARNFEHLHNYATSGIYETLKQYAMDWPVLSDVIANWEEAAAKATAFAANAEAAEVEHDQSDCIDATESDGDFPPTAPSPALGFFPAKPKHVASLAKSPKQPAQPPPSKILQQASCKQITNSICNICTYVYI
jgi:hypothetical protein